jgi:NAD(P)-dependent dehydrogenase (short-subunit alcohol dehydrogenase family)
MADDLDRGDSLEGKVALVTGAGRGLGRVVAIALAKRGAKVALVARDPQSLAAVAEEICGFDATALALPADVSRVEEVQSCCARAGSQLGAVQVLINAAGVFGPIQLVKDSDPVRWIETLNTNTIGPYLFCRELLGGMLARGWGRIINFSSAASLHPPGPLNSAYGTSKVALNQFTRHLAAELAGSGVTANVIHPGEVKTHMWATIRDESQQAGPEGDGYRAWAADVGRTGGDDPQKAVDLVLELTSDRGALVNGKFLWIAGGVQTPIPSW